MLTYCMVFRCVCSFFTSYSVVGERRKERGKKVKKKKERKEEKKEKKKKEKEKKKTKEKIQSFVCLLNPKKHTIL